MPAPRPALYHHFSDEKRLFAAVAEDCGEGEIDAVVADGNERGRYRDRGSLR